MAAASLLLPSCAWSAVLPAALLVNSGSVALGFLDSRVNPMMAVLSTAMLFSSCSDSAHRCGSHRRLTVPRQPHYTLGPRQHLAACRPALVARKPPIALMSHTRFSPTHLTLLY